MQKRVPESSLFGPSRQPMPLWRLVAAAVVTALIMTIGVPAIGALDRAVNPPMKPLALR